MKPSKCKICEHEHWGLAHVFATNKESATNNEAEKATKKATNSAPPKAAHLVVRDSPGLGVVEQSASGGAGAGRNGKRVKSEREARPTANRRNREAYNAYQREYMRKKRAKA